MTGSIAPLNRFTPITSSAQARAGLTRTTTQAHHGVALRAIAQPTREANHRPPVVAPVVDRL